MKQDDEIDKLFKDNLENSSIPDIPQAYLDNLNKRLDTITPTTKFGNPQYLLGKYKLLSENFQSLFGIFSILGVVGIISLVIYFVVFNSKSDKLKNENKNISVKSTTTTDFNNNSSTNTAQINNNNENNTITELENNESEQVISATDKSTSISSLSTISEKALDNSTEEKPIEKASENTTNTFSSKRNNKTNNLVSEQYQAKADKKAVNIKSNSLSKQEQLANVAKDTKVEKNKFDKKDRNKNMDQNALVDETIADKETGNKETFKSVKSIAKNITNKYNKPQSSALAKAIKKSNIELNNKKDLTDVNVLKTEATILSVPSNNMDSVQSDANKSLTSTTDKKDSLNNINKQLIVDNHNSDSLKNAGADTLALAAKDSAQQKNVAALKPIIDSLANILKGVKSVQLLIGAANVNSIFASKNANYDAKRKSEENAILVFDASLLISYSKNKFIYSLGVNYSKWGEKVSYTATIDSVNYLKGQDTTYTTVQKDSVTFITVPSVYSVYGNKVSSNESIVYNGKNKYTYLSIPFLFGYKFGNNLFSIIPKIGGMVGIPLSSKGYYVSSDFKKLIEEKASSLLFNVQLSLDLQKKIGSYASICISPVVRSNVSPLIHSVNTSNRYYMYGIQIGMSYIIH